MAEEGELSVQVLRRNGVATHRRRGRVRIIFWYLLSLSLSYTLIRSFSQCHSRFFISYSPECYKFTVSGGRVFTVPYFLGILSIVSRNFVSPRPSKKTTKLLIISLPHNTSKRENPPTADFSLLPRPYFWVENLSSYSTLRLQQLKKVPAHSHPISIPRDLPSDQLERCNVTDHDGLPSTTSTM